MRNCWLLLCTRLDCLHQDTMSQWSMTPPCFLILHWYLLVAPLHETRLLTSGHLGLLAHSLYFAGCSHYGIYLLLLLDLRTVGLPYLLNNMIKLNIYFLIYFMDHYLVYCRNEPSLQDFLSIGQPKIDLHQIHVYRELLEHQCLVDRLV